MSKFTHRLVFDIGSGTTKASLVKLCSTSGHYVHGPDSVLFGDELPVLLGHALKSNPERRISEELIKQVEAAVEAHLAKSKTFLENVADAKVQMRGVATAAIRESVNGAEIIERLNSKYNIGVVVISQDEEGRLGFLTATTLAGVSDACVWDSGGASFQFSRMIGGKCEVVNGPWGDSKVTAAMVETIQKKSFATCTNPNPCTLEEAEALRDLIAADVAALKPSWFQGVPVICIGGPPGVFHVATTIAGTREIAVDEVWVAMQKKLLNRTSEDIKTATGLTACNMAVPKICLLAGVMKAFGFSNTLQFDAIGSTVGIAADEEFWK